MPAVIPAIVVLICLVGIGATAANYVGMSPSEAFDYCKTHHDYSISETEFNSIYNEYHDNPDYAGITITQQDVNKVTQTGVNLYDMAVSYGRNIALPYILGSFDTTWQPVSGAREIKYYTQDGQLMSSIRIYGWVRGEYMYSSNIQSPPELIAGDVYGTNLCFVSVDSQGTIHYHTDIGFNIGGSMGIRPQYFGATQSSDCDMLASIVSFKPYNGDIGMWGKDNWVSIFGQGVFAGVRPQVADGVPDVVEPEQDTIGVATYNGVDLPVYPDGSIALPNGTTVYPDSTTGQYPSDITVRLDEDYWARLAELLGANTATGSAAADTQTTNLNLEGLRSIASSTLDYLKNGFWTDFKNKLGEFFSIDTDKYRVSYQNPFTIIPSYVDKVCRIFGYQPSNQ